MKPIAILLICFLIFSCKTKEIIKSNTEVKSSTETNVSKVEETKLDTKSVSAIAQNVTETDNTVIQETVTELSKPDTLGKQYPEKVTQRTITSGKNKQTKTNGNAQTEQKIDNKVTEAGSKTEDKVLNNETDIKVVKKNQSWKMIALIVLGLAIIGFIVYKLKWNWIKKVITKLKR